MPVLNPAEIRAIFLIDVDGTALREELGNGWKNESWFLLTKGFGADINDHIRIYSEYRKSITHNLEKDKLLHDQLVADLLKLWTEAWGDEITEVELIAACRAIKSRISKELKIAVRELISNKILVIMGTGGFELAAQAIAEELDLEEQSVEGIIEYWFGNTKFVFDEAGILTRFDHDKNVAGRKAAQADEKVQEIFQIIGKRVPIFATGDGLSDIALFTRPDVNGIAFNAESDELRMAAVAIETDWPGVTNAILKKLSVMETE